MKNLLSLLIILFSICGFSQTAQLSQNYFDRGDFEKALLVYEELLKSQPSNGMYFQRQIECLQQLSQFEKAQTLLKNRINIYKQPNLLVEIGYNYQLQKNQIKANDFYEQAIETIKQNPSNVYGVATLFERKVLLELSLKAYKTAIEKQPDMNFNYQMGMLYGQLGNTDLMIEKLLVEAQANPQNSIMVQSQLTRFMQEDTSDNFAQILKKSLLIRAQKSQDLVWNQYLSWFFVQQKEYGIAFIQEKAIYKRDPESFYNIVNLAALSAEEGQFDTAANILNFILQNANNIDLKIQSHTSLQEIKINRSTPAENPLIIAEFERLFTEFGLGTNSLSLQILYANFLTFKAKNPEQSRAILKNCLLLPINKYQEAEVKMQLADVLLFEEKFNQAQILYTQIQEDLSQDEVGNEASLKAAKTSYYKGEFDWALQQFKALKSASSQLIANDALELYLLINDSKNSDSTFVALKKFAKGDYQLYQKKSAEALALFQSILKENKGDEIEPAALIRVGKIYESNNDFTNALLQYEAIISNHKDAIYADEALFFAAEIFLNKLNLPEKAKPMYEKIIFEHQDSIFFVEARTKFRQIRGDKTL